MSDIDFFDRQRRIPGWDQELIGQQVCLCLGAGGIGTSVILGLSRLGVKKIHVVDFDVVEVHNLNRQVLYNRNSVGQSKALQSTEAAKVGHALETEIVAHHFDVRLEWPKVVEMAKESTVVFNMIDIGDQFDVVVQALALTLKLPMIQGGTFRTSLNLETFSGHGIPCLWCANPNVGNEFIEKCKPGETALALKDLSFLQSDDHPTGASSVFVALTAGQLMLANWTNLLFFQQQQEYKAKNQPLPQDVQERPPPFTRIFMYLDNMDIDKFMIEPEVGCLLCPGKPKPIPTAEQPSQADTMNLEVKHTPEMEKDDNLQKKREEEEEEKDKEKTGLEEEKTDLHVKKTDLEVEAGEKKN
jgi:molybdopterin/thiamine biosynthesis adenylyltransferase